MSGTPITTCPTPAGRSVPLTRHLGGLYWYEGPGVKGYRFHGGAALEAARKAAARDVAADEMRSLIPHGPIVRSVLPGDASRHKREGFPRAHRETVREVVETLVLQGPPDGWQASRYAQRPAAFGRMAARADSERAYVVAHTLAKTLRDFSDPAHDPHWGTRVRHDRAPYCDPVVRLHREAVERVAGERVAMVARSTGSAARVAAHRARVASADPDTRADKELTAMREAAARAAGGADALSWQDVPRRGTGRAKLPLAS